MVRRLPVFSSSADEDERPAWQWTGVGVIFVYAIWMPLSMAGTWVSTRFIGRTFGDAPQEELTHLVTEAPAATRIGLGLVTLALPMACYAFACWAAGALIGRFGGRVTPRHATVAGVLSALLAVAMIVPTSRSGASSAALLLLVPIGGLAAWLGGRFGVRLRHRSFLRPPPPTPG
jgi:hypothetical protein